MINVNVTEKAKKNVVMYAIVEKMARIYKIAEIFYVITAIL